MSLLLSVRPTRVPVLDYVANQQWLRDFTIPRCPGKRRGKIPALTLRPSLRERASKPFHFVVKSLHAFRTAVHLKSELDLREPVCPLQER